MAQVYKIGLILCLFFISQNTFASSLSCITPEGGEGRCMLLRKCLQIPPLPIQSPRREITLKELFSLRRTGKICPLGLVCCSTSLPPTLVLAPRVGADEVSTKQNVSQSVAQDPFSSIPQVQTPPPVPVAITDRRLGRLPLETCGLSVVNFIVDGVRAESGQFPWMALLCAGIGNVQGTCTCSGTVIARKYILTAASCISFLPPGYPRPSMAVLGDVDSNSATATTAQRFGIQRYVPHPDFNPEKNREHDVAVLWLNKEIDFNHGIIRPVCIPFGRSQFKNFDSTTDLTVAGWGTSDRSNSTVRNQVPKMSQFLQYAMVRTITNARCTTLYADKAVITAAMICAGRSYEGPCTGDIGGALTTLDYINITDNLRVTQVGINSWNPVPCGTPANPGVYTRVGYYVDWILDQIP